MADDHIARTTGQLFHPYGNTRDNLLALHKPLDPIGGVFLRGEGLQPGMAWASDFEKALETRTYPRSSNVVHCSIVNMLPPFPLMPILPFLTIKTQRDSRM